MKYLNKYKLGMLAASAFLLVACNGDDNGTDDPDNGGDVETVDPDSLGGSIEVGVGDDYMGLVEEVAANFEEEFGVEVVVTERDMFDTLEALPLDGPADLSPDVLLSPYDRIGGLGQQGHLAPLTLPEEGEYDETDILQVTINDQIYGVPYIIESLVMFYNEDLLDSAPETFEDLEALLDDEQYDFPGQAGTSTAFFGNWVDFYHSYGVISGFGGYVFGDDGSDPNDVGLNTPEAVEGIEYAQFWLSEVWPEGMLDVTSSYDFMTDQFLNGNTAALINGPWGAGDYIESGMNFGVSTIPTLPNGNAFEPFAGGKGWVIPSYTENFEAAQAFVEYISNQENSMLMYEEYTFEIPANQPAREAILDAGDNDLAIAVIEQYNNAVPMPNIPEMAEVWTGAETMMFDAGSGNKTAEESANDAVQIITDNIEQIYQ